jgi:hypothetical protein
MCSPTQCSTMCNTLHRRTHVMLSNTAGALHTAHMLQPQILSMATLQASSVSNVCCTCKQLEQTPNRKGLVVCHTKCGHRLWPAASTGCANYLRANSAEKSCSHAIASMYSTRLHILGPQPPQHSEDVTAVPKTHTTHMLVQR